jgi:hypothetical protein
MISIELNTGMVAVGIEMETLDEKVVYFVIKVENILEVSLGFKPGTSEKQFRNFTAEQTSFLRFQIE